MRNFYKSIASSALYKYLTYAVQLVSLALLSRFFNPEVFGVFSMLNVLSVFVILLGELGFGPAIIGISNEREKTEATAFKISVIASIVSSFLFIFVSFLAQKFFQVSFSFISLALFSIGTGLLVLCTVPQALLYREKGFFYIARSEMIAEIFGLFAALLFWKLGYKIEALCAKFFVASVLKCFLLTVASRILTTFKIKTADFTLPSSFLYFCKNQIKFNILNYFSRNLDNILVGRFFSVTDLGVYDKTYQLMKYPLLLLSQSIVPAIQPSLNGLSGIKETVEIHRKLVLVLGLCGALVGSFVNYFSHYIVLILYGQQWLSVVPLIKIFSATIAMQVVLSTSGGFFQAKNRSDLMLRSGKFSFVTNVTAICLGTMSGSLEVLCWCLVVSFFVNFMQCYVLLISKVLNENCTNHWFHLIVPQFVNLSLFSLVY